MTAMVKSPTARITGSRLTEFEPANLGSFSSAFREILAQLAGLRQSEIIKLLESEAVQVTDSASEADARSFRVAVLVLRDYVEAGNYPVVRNGRCYLASLVDSSSLTDEQQRGVLKHQYQVARDRALRERGQLDWLKASVRSLQQGGYSAHDVVSDLVTGPPDLQLIDTRDKSLGFDVRSLWRCVRSTWSMAPETSAPGREMAFLAVNPRWPITPLGILQFRNVVPEISARDLWFGSSVGELVGSDHSGTGFLGLLSANEGEVGEKARATLTMMTSLCTNIRTDGIEVPFNEESIDALGALVRVERVRFDETRRAGAQGLNNEHLKRVKRAQTAQDLLRGIRALRLVVDAAAPLDSLDIDTKRDLAAGLMKIWHYQMGFVAIEMSICGAAPPFGPLRAGKLMAGLAGSDEVVRKWGVDRPLGVIAQEVYHPEVRDEVPNLGPLAVFTSGLFPGHSAQYNRVVSGTQRWRKIGATSGYGSFHIAFETTEAMRRLDESVQGYQHVTRRFGEGSGARFRSVGRALTYLGLPDFRKHETQRPLYALPLVANPQASLLGWEQPIRHPFPTPSEIAGQWWHRWVEPSVASLVRTARESPDLEATMFSMLSSEMVSED